jgi:hypothetical protein
MNLTEKMEANPKPIRSLSPTCMTLSYMRFVMTQRHALSNASFEKWMGTI